MTRACAEAQQPVWLQRSVVSLCHCLLLLLHQLSSVLIQLFTCVALLIFVPCRPGNRGITACCFSPDGTKLVCICTDNQHTMYIWDWKRKRVR